MGIISPDTAAAVRLDVWLDVSCLFRTRSEAQKACNGGKIEVNGQSAKPHRMLHVDDSVSITRGHGRTQTVCVRALAGQHIPKSEARRLYEDLTPAPTPEEIEMRRLDRVFHAAMTPPRAPDKRARRLLRKIKEQ